MPEAKKPSTFLAVNIYAKNVCSACKSPSTAVLYNSKGTFYLCLTHINNYQKELDKRLVLQEKKQWSHAEWYRELVLGENVDQLALV